MPVSFEQVPVNTRVPFVYIEFNNRFAVQSSTTLKYKLLLTGQRLSTGTVGELVPKQITRAEYAKEYFGSGSQLALMADALLKNDTSTEVWAIALDDAASAVAAAGTVTFTGTATESGTYNLYIGGVRVRIPVVSGDTNETIAASAVAEINSLEDLCVTAAVNGTIASQVDITAKNKGTAGNQIPLMENYYDESVPAGITTAIAAMSGGSTDPDTAALVAAMGDIWYNLIAWPWTDATNLTGIENKLSASFGPSVQKDGVAVCATNGTFADLSTLGDSRNSPHLTIMDAHSSPTPAWIWSAAVTGALSLPAQADPSRPFRTIEVKGVLPAKESSWFTTDERNLLLYDGISTHTVDAGGRVLLERMITTYKKNSLGADDESYLKLNTMLTLALLRYDLRQMILVNFPRHKFADDGTNFGPGQAIVTPKILKAHFAAKAREWEYNGYVENVDNLIKSMVVEKVGDRCNFILSPDLINQFLVAAGRIDFML